MLRETALHNAYGPSTQSGQRSTLARVNVSKGVAHRAENPGGQYARTVQALLGHEESAPGVRQPRWAASETPTGVA